MKRLVLAATLLALASVPGAADDQALLKDAQSYFKPIPSIVPAVKNNAVTREKVELGKIVGLPCPSGLVNPYTPNM